MHAGRQVINSSYLYTYLDHSYPLLPLRKTYQFDPIFEGLDSTSSNNLLGLEGLMWGEWLPNHRRVEFQTFPRLIALAETGWSTNRQEYPHFSTRLKPFLTRLDLRDVGYASLRTSQPSISKRIFGLASIAFAKSGISKPMKEELP
jgi:hexosaminidase